MDNINPEERHVGERDYFAEELLGKLDSQDPIQAAFEAQDVSREVGFDFTDMAGVLERALDEVRETKEAYEEGEEGREHLGDEMADLAFSLTNLIRHKGIPAGELSSVDSFTPEASSTVDVYEASDSVAADMRGIADEGTTEEEALLLYAKGVETCASLADAHGFDIGELLRQNVRKYLDRCSAIETLAREEAKSWSDLAAAGEIVSYWKRAKSLL